MTKEDEQVLERLFIELKRESLVLSILSPVVQQQYGYSLIVTLQKNGWKDIVSTITSLRKIVIVKK